LENKKLEGNKMEVKLTKKPTNCTLIEGFPGFGLVGTIASEFLIEHLKFEKIGKIISDDTPPTVAIHNGTIVEPLGIFYNKKHNLILLHAIAASAGLEWKLSEIIGNLTKQLSIKEIICLEGVGSNQGSQTSRVFYYANNDKNKKKLENLKIEQLKEGIIIGVTGAVILRLEKIGIIAIFSETHSNLPDSKAAAKIIEVLDKLLKLKVDYKPLLVQAEKFEKKLKGMLSESNNAQRISEKKRLSYVG
jgi:uncharacterized protein